MSDRWVRRLVPRRHAAKEGRMAVIDFRKPLDRRETRDGLTDQNLILPGERAGVLHVPMGAKRLVIFVQAVAAARTDPRNRAVAQALHQRGFATLLFDLVTPAEEEDRHVIFDIDRLAARLVDVAHWIAADRELGAFSLGFFAANIGAAAALVAAARLGSSLGAVVARGAQPDLAGLHLNSISAPTLLIVGSRDSAVISQNEQARKRLRGPSALKIVLDAGHFFDEPGALTTATDYAAHWFAAHLAEARPPATESVCSNG
jgi:putative phosphoribosyl transferase